MPSYQNLFPPISLAPGDVGFSFNNEAFPGGAPSATALPSRYPAALQNSKLQTGSRLIDAEYQTVDTSTATGGKVRLVTGVQAKFLRIKFVSSTGGAGLTAKLPCA